MGLTKNDNRKTLRVTDKRGKGEPESKLLSAEEQKEA